MVLYHQRSLLRYRHQGTGKGQICIIGYVYRSGPRMDPWGTPINRSKNELYEEFMFPVSEVAIN